MKVEIKTGGNGIHQTYSILATNIEKSDLIFLASLVEIVDKYQKEAIDQS